MYLTRTAGIETDAITLAKSSLRMYLTRTAGIETLKLRLVLLGLPYKCILPALRELKLIVDRERGCFGVKCILPALREFSLSIHQ